MNNEKRSFRLAVWFASGFLLFQPNGMAATNDAVVARIDASSIHLKPVVQIDRDYSLTARQKGGNPLAGKPPACPGNPNTNCPPTPSPSPRRR